MLIATLSYGKFEIIQLKREESATKSNESRKVLFILQVFVGALTLPLLTDSLYHVFSIIKRI